MKWLLFILFMGITFNLGASPPKHFCSKKGNFSIEVPQLMGKTNIDRHEEEGYSCISVSDDFGTLFRIDHSEMDKTLSQEIKLISEEMALRQLFDTTMLCLIKLVLPEAKILQTELIELSSGQAAQFHLIDMPKGSVLKDCLSEGRINSMRGILTFIDRGYVTFLSYQTDLTFVKPELLPFDQQTIVARYLSTLKKAADSFVKK